MIPQIEDAIISRIQGATGLGYTLKTVASYSGEFDEDLNAAVRWFPAVWVAFSSAATPKRKSEKKWLVPLTFTIFIATQNVRGERVARHGEVGAVGSYQVLTDIQALLLGQDLGLAIDPLTPGEVENLFSGRRMSQAMSVLSQQWHTEYVLTQPTPADLADLLKVGMNYHLQPDDGASDASDLVTLR